jgi:hypothetical protein
MEDLNLAGSKQANKQIRGFAFFALLLWAQLIFSVGLTMWRHSLVLFSGWTAYPSGVPPTYDDFITLALQHCTSDAPAIYLSPPGDVYTARYARIHYFLYPRKIIWLGLGPTTSPVARWQPFELSADQLQQTVDNYEAGCLLVDDVPTPVSLINRQRIYFDSAHYILVLGS